MSKNELQTKVSQTPIEIALQIDEYGMTTAKKLYEFLGLNPKNYSHWVKRNITENDFAEETVDYWSFVIKDERNINNPKPTTDYRLSSHFAKKLSMKGDSKRSEQAREYFALVEEKTKEKMSTQIPLTTEGQIRLLAQGNVELNKKVEQVTENVETLREDLTNLRMDLPILPIEADRITYASKKRGVDLLGGKTSPAYNDKKLRMKLYKNLYKDLKYQFNVTSYKQIKRSQCEKAIEIINEYQPPFFLSEEIANANAQQSLFN